jgi:hypothetical protein
MQLISYENKKKKLDIFLKKLIFAFQNSSFKISIKKWKKDYFIAVKIATNLWNNFYHF